MHRRKKGTAEIVTYEFEFARVLENLWLPGATFTLGEYTRPTIPNGFEYECTDDGQSAQHEPDWPTTIGGTVEDGSIVWTCRDFAGQASDTINTRLVTAEGTLVVETSSIVQTKVLATISGGAVGECSDVQCLITTAAGETYTETLRLTVTE